MKIALAALALLIVVPSHATAPEPSIKPVSVAWAAQGFALLAHKQPVAAEDRFETALAVDPTNRRAYIGLAEAARAQALPGKAIRYYREALVLEPNDLDALSGRAQALAERGATARAQIDLARIEKLCGARTCAAALAARSAIAAATAPGRTAAAAPVVSARVAHD